MRKERNWWRIRDLRPGKRKDRKERVIAGSERRKGWGISGRKRERELVKGGREN